MTDRETMSKYAYDLARRMRRRTPLAVLRSELSVVERMVESLAVQHGQLMSLRNADLEDLAFRDAEFRIFSQWGEDGIIQYLVARTTPGPSTFVEFGVGDYTESNTRFLLLKDNWRGLIIDGATDLISFLRRSGTMWRHYIDPVVAFVTVENINSILSEHDMVGDIGILSVDIDGNDYWVLDAITIIQPRIIICEYNSVFGSQRAVTIPYDPDFVAGSAHYSHLYFGASLAALDHLLSDRGYILVGCESHGANAFFVRSDVALALPSVTPAAAYVTSQFRSSRSELSRLSYVNGHRAMRALIADLPLIDVTTGTRLVVGDLPTD
jgi:hypothetical protein